MIWTVNLRVTKVSNLDAEETVEAETEEEALAEAKALYETENHDAWNNELTMVEVTGVEEEERDDCPFCTMVEVDGDLVHEEGCRLFDRPDLED